MCPKLHCQRSWTSAAVKSQWCKRDCFIMEELFSRKNWSQDAFMSRLCVFRNQLKKSSSAGRILLSSVVSAGLLWSHLSESPLWCRGRVSAHVQICCGCSFIIHFSLFIGTKTVTPSQAWPVKRIYWIGHHLEKTTQGKRDSLPGCSA